MKIVIFCPARQSVPQANIFIQILIFSIEKFILSSKNTKFFARAFALLLVITRKLHLSSFRLYPPPPHPKFFSGYATGIIADSKFFQHYVPPLKNPGYATGRHSPVRDNSVRRFGAMQLARPGWDNSLPHFLLQYLEDLIEALYYWRMTL